MISQTNHETAIVALIQKHPNTAVALVIEPDSLPNLVTNLDDPKCAAASDDYQNGIAYAVEQLNLPNVAMYIDAGHGGWLGWPDKTRKNPSTTPVHNRHTDTRSQSPALI